jgi:hypothetical protein
MDNITGAAGTLGNSAPNSNEGDSAIATLKGIGASQAMIEFEMDGTITTANENFLGAMGYQLSEIVGKHHSIFATEEYKATRIQVASATGGSMPKNT